MTCAPVRTNSTASASKTVPLTALEFSDNASALIALTRLLARQAAHEFLNKSHETDDRSGEPPRNAAR